jgi:sulfite reductase (NADPH) flavoprotein alpha-component
MFGSQTGTAEGLSKRLAKEASQRGLAPRVLPLNDYEAAALPQAEKLVIICSTWGDGDPPDNATGFWTWLNSDAAPALEKLHFAVLGLGDKNYADFCGASKKFDTRLEALGAHRLIPRGECDVDYEPTAQTWFETLWPKLTSNSSSTSGSSNGHSRTALSMSPSPPLEERAGERRPTVTNHQSSIPNHKSSFQAPLLKNLLLNKPGSSKEVRHYEISLEGSGLTYEVGDALGVIPSNCPDLVAELIVALQSSADSPVRLGDTDLPLDEALTRHLDITRPSRDLLDFVARHVTDSDLPALLAPERAADLKQWLYGRDVLDILNLLSEPLPLEQFIPSTRKLAPRLYSISSSPKAHPGEVHLTVSALRYESHGRPRKGVASTFLADRVLMVPGADAAFPERLSLNGSQTASSPSKEDMECAAPRMVSTITFEKNEVSVPPLSFRRGEGQGGEGLLKSPHSSFLQVFVHRSPSFKLPPSPDTPIIMIGPGTGIAPFRAFLEERAVVAATGKNWLFFGDQKRATDFLYEESLTEWLKSGHLARLDLAFSRDQPEKIYVQDRMRENAAELWSWLESGAHFYVCGDASRMAKDVDAALHQIIQTAGRKGAEEARQYVQNLKSQKRYQRDVY